MRDGLCVLNDIAVSYTHLTYRNYDSLVTWVDGSRVHLQQSVDITALVSANTDELTGMLSRRAGKERLGISLCLLYTSYDARANVMWAGMLCHQGLAGVGRHEDWATHGLEHELSALYPEITHGAGLAVMFPAWMEFVYDANPARFAYYGRCV